MALIYPSVILTSAAVAGAILLGGLLCGLDRILTARLQSRKGPRLSQPFWDVAKLMGKRAALVNPWQAFCARASFGAAIMAVALLASGANLLLVIFVYSAVGAFLVLGAMGSLSPYSQTGAQRQLWQMLCCEAVLFFMAAAFYRICGSFLVTRLFTLAEPALFRAPLLFVAFLFALTVEMRKSPFDVAASQHAHQELVRGVFTEYGGAHLAWLEVGHWLEIVLYLGIASLFWTTSPWGMVLLPMGSFLAVVLLDNVSARLTWRWMVGRGLVVVLALASINLGWLVWGRP